MPEPWEQLRGEPQESFNRFLFYRNLGPARSLSRAYRHYLQSLPPDPEKPAEATKSLKRLHVPGNWIDDSQRHKWAKRAASWDTSLLLKMGSDLAPFWNQILRDVVRKAAEALLSTKLKPKSWKDVLLVLDKISPYLNPDVLKANQLGAGDGEQPPVIGHGDTTVPTSAIPPRLYEPAHELGPEGLPALKDPKSSVK
jgi:hypothetical protein